MNPISGSFLRGICRNFESESGIDYENESEILFLNIRKRFVGKDEILGEEEKL